MLTVRRTLAALAVVAVVIAAVVAAAGPAAAHTELEQVSPAPGTSVPAEVRTIRLTFSGPVTADGATIELLGESGAPIPLVVRGAARPDALTAALPDGISGSFTVRWRAAAADGHPVEGGFGLGFGGAPAPTAATVSATLGASAPGRSADPSSPGAEEAESARRLLTASRIASYLGLAVLVGGWCFLAVVWPAGAGATRTRRLLGGALAVTAAGTAVGFAAEGAVLRRDLGALGSLEAWKDVLELPFGRAWAARGALLVLAVPVGRSLARHGEAAARAAWWRVAAAAVGVGLLRTPGFVAHATEGDGGALGSVADLVHLIGIAAWLGGLVLLCAVVLPRRRTQELAVVVPRFSRLAMASMIAIVVGGTAMSWQLLDGPSSLWSTEFGRVLAAKLAVFAAALGAAYVSKRWVDGRLVLAVADADVAAGGAGRAAAAVRPFVLSAAAEVVLAVAAVSIASVLVGTSPPT